MKKDRPKVLLSTTTKMQTGCGSLYIIVSTYPDGTPAEIFLTKGRAGGCIFSLMNIIGRLASIALRSGVPMEEVIEQFKDEKCPQSIDKAPKALSCGDAIAVAISQQVCNITPPVKKESMYSGTLQKYCPRCDKNTKDCECG